MNMKCKKTRTTTLTKAELNKINEYTNDGTLKNLD